MAIVNKAYKCDHCGALHDEKSEDFFRIQGNLFVGEAGGVIGPDADMVFCRKAPCNGTVFHAATQQPKITTRKSTPPQQDAIDDYHAQRMYPSTRD